MLPQSLWSEPQFSVRSSPFHAERFSEVTEVYIARWVSLKRSWGRKVHTYVGGRWYLEAVFRARALQLLMRSDEEVTHPSTNACAVLIVCNWRIKTLVYLQAQKCANIVSPRSK